MIYLLVTYGAFCLFLLVVGLGCDVVRWWRGRDPLERVFGADLAEVRSLPECREPGERVR